jgi:hypothetical protein
MFIIISHVYGWGMKTIDITQPPWEARPITAQDLGTDTGAILNRVFESHSTPSHEEGLRIIIPAGKYRFDSTANVTIASIIEGEGGQHKELGGTIIIPKSGVTPFRYSGPRSVRSVLRDIVIFSKGQKATDTRRGNFINGRKDSSGNIVDPLQQLILDNEWNELKEGQLIAIPGGGPTVRLTGHTVTNGKKYVPPPNLPPNDRLPDPDKDHIRVIFDSSRKNGIAHGFWKGSYVRIPRYNILDPPAKVVKTNPFDPTFIVDCDKDLLTFNPQDELVANDKEEDSHVYLVCEALARVGPRVGGNNKAVEVTTYLTIGNSINGVEIRHADAGVDIGSHVTCENIGAHGMQGPGFVVLGLDSKTNSNMTRLDKCYAQECDYGVYISGGEASAGVTINFEALAIEKYCIADFSAWGNTHVAPHVQGGFGVITTDKIYKPENKKLEDGHCRAVIVGPYSETGTVSFIGSKTVAVGGSLDRVDAGGWVWIDGVFNQFQVGDASNEAPDFSLYERRFFPKDYLEWYKSRGSKTYKVKKINGWYAHKLIMDFEGDRGPVPYCWSDEEAEGGAAQFWVPRGLRIGDIVRNEEDLRIGNSIKIDIAAIDIAAGGRPPAVDTNTQRGDIIFNKTAKPGDSVGWVCCETDRGAKEWRPFGKIE